MKVENVLLWALWLEVERIKRFRAIARVVDDLRLSIRFRLSSGSFALASKAKFRELVMEKKARVLGVVVKSLVIGDEGI